MAASRPSPEAYNASKFALEGLADALRLELAPWRVGVVLVEPPQVDTAIWRDAERHIDAKMAGLSADHRTLYARHFEGYRSTIPASRKIAIPAELVAETIEKALTARRPRARYVPGSAQRVQAAVALRLPTALRDRVLRRAGRRPLKRIEAERAFQA